MRILFLNHNVAWVGGFFRAYHWGRYLRKKGHSVTIITISEHEKVRFSVVQKDDVTIIKSPDLLSGNLRSGWDPWDVLARAWYIKNKEFDIIHCVDTRPNVVLPALFLRWKSGGRLVMDWGDWWGRGGTISVRDGGVLGKLFEPIETLS